jgi:hypothetical protein
LTRPVNLSDGETGENETLELDISLIIYYMCCLYILLKLNCKKIEILFKLLVNYNNKMSVYTIKEVIGYLNEKLPDSKGKKIAIQEILKMLNILFIEREQYFAEHFIHHDDWPDDDEYNTINDYIDFINQEINKKQI